MDGMLCFARKTFVVTAREQWHCHGAGSNCQNVTSQNDVCAQRRGGVAGLFRRIPYLPSVL